METTDCDGNLDSNPGCGYLSTSNMTYGEGKWTVLLIRELMPIITFS